MKDIVAECTNFIAACYMSNKRENMSQARIDVWSNKVAKPKPRKAPELRSIPQPPLKLLNKMFEVTHTN